MSGSATVGSERGTSDRPATRNQPSSRAQAAQRPATPTRQPAASPRPASRERTNFSAEARGGERSNGNRAVAGLTANFGPSSVESGPSRNSSGRLSAAAGARGSLRPESVTGARLTRAAGAHSPNEQGNHWRSEDAEMNPRIRQVLERVAPRFHGERQQDLVVVSGARGPERSADTLLDQSPQERRRLYGEQRNFGNYERAIAQSEAQARSENPFSPRDRAREFLSQRIGQMTRGNDNNYISEHQSGHSFDISVTRSRLGVDDIQAATRLFREAGMRVLFEGDHLHVDIPTPDHRPLTSANPTITFREAQTVNGFQREDELRAGVGTPRQPYEHRAVDPNLARRRIAPSPGQQNSLQARIDQVVRMISSYAWLSAGGAQYALPQLP